MIRAKVLFGSEAARHYDDTGEIPGPGMFEDSGSILCLKEFSSRELYDAYVAGLEDGDGFNEYRVIDFDETPDRTLDARVGDMMREGPLVVLYFKAGIDILNEHVSRMTDDELCAIFGSLLAPQRIRGNLRVISNRLNDLPDDHLPE